LLAACAAACSSKPEEAILQQFFRASRLRDTTSLAGFSVARFDPQTEGTIVSFEVVGISPEQRTPMTLSGLSKEHEAVADAQRKLNTESAIVSLSLENPDNPVDAAKHEGDIVTKDVTITAPVRMPSGTSADRTLVVTMQRAVLKADPEIAGKWIITSLKDATGSPAAKTS
jgi:hypothetical protein